MSDRETDLPQTPLYRALQSDRYARQAAISSIEQLTRRRLIVYEANLWSKRSSLGEEDIQPFGDLLVRISPGEEVDNTGRLSPAYFPLLEGLNLGFIRMCRNLMDRSRKFAEKWLKMYMLKKDPKGATKLAVDLCNVRKWLSHGVVIDADEAARIGVKVNKLQQDNDLWKQIWYLHCCYGVLFRRTAIAKVYESRTVSLPFE